MKKYIGLLVLGLVLSFSGLKAQDWVAFRAANCLCKTSFPATPDLEQKQNAGFKSHKATATVGATVFLLDYSILSEPAAKDMSKSYADESVSAFSDALGASLVKDKKWKVKGWEGRRTEMRTSEGFVVYYHTVMVRSIHYQIAVVGEEPDKKMVKKFLKSFKVL